MSNDNFQHIKLTAVSRTVKNIRRAAEQSVAQILIGDKAKNPEGRIGMILGAKYNLKRETTSVLFSSAGIRQWLSPLCLQKVQA